MIGTIIGVVIGLAFVYLLLSLIATWIQELIATLLRWRSKELVNVIENLLDPSTKKLAGVKKLEEKLTEGAGIIERIKKNPVKVFYEQPVIRSLAKPNRLPSYIPAREFSSVIIDIVSKAGTEASPALRGLEAFKRGVADIDNQTTRGALELFISIVEEKQTQVEEKIAGLRDRIAEWFDDAMERAAGWYKRKSQVAALIVGLLLAVAFNVNTISLVDSLWSDEPIRRHVNAAAVEYVESQPEKLPGELIKLMEDLRLPIGWYLENIPSSWDWLLHILGWIVTGFAVSQGAPVWFDLLNRIINLRGSGKKPAVSKKTG